MKRIGMFIAVSAVVGSWCGSARAGLVTWQFDGVVTAIDDDGGLVTGLVEVGSPFSASITFDPDTPDSSHSATIGSYDDAVVEASGLIGDISLVPIVGSSWIRVFNDDPVDSLRFFTRGVDSEMLAEQVWLSIVMVDLEAQVLEDDSLPVFPLFAQGGFRMGNEFETWYIHGTVTSIVPEPGGLALLVAGVVAVLPRRSQRSRLRSITVLMGAIISLGD